MNQSEDILCIRLRSGVLIRMSVMAVEPPAVEMSDAMYADTRKAGYLEMIEAGQMITAGRAEAWKEQAHVKELERREA